MSPYRLRGNSCIIVRSCARYIMIPMRVARKRNRPERPGYYWRMFSGDKDA